MKLQSQLTAAFTALLLVIMAVAWYVIYSLILDLLIQDEQRQLKQTGELLVNVLNQQYGTADIQQVNDILKDQDLQMFMYDRKHDQVLLSTMSNQVAREFFKNNDFADTNKTQWEYGKERFVTSRIIFLPEQSGLELILLTPVSDLQGVQQNFFTRIFFIFIIGAFAAVLISYYLTRKLVTPLSKLKRQLKKIEKRQFDDIEHIKATGEIKEVADSVYEMANELQRYMSTQQTFFQNASHELKTPLMTIQGYAEGIKDGIFTEKEAEKGLEVMVSEVNRLKVIINEMILLAKLDSEPSVYDPVKIEVSELIDQVVDRAIPFVNEKGITLRHEVKENITLFADEEKLLRALLNIVFNGIRHAESQIEINVLKKSRRILITIGDDGEGISKEVASNIFHRFVKGKNGETGLGLAIARAIIEQSNGKITVGRSKLGGAEFKINLPE
ncbi:sensor histidine kinase [Oceanobacillus zhaokaii]|jgi:signal transduction histidine kinase|uniref:histidine kinase n=1 Tax=Oceanobacillus zhaokaii TaxID=2052660 RepID=A0A345PDC5_9BACI|nr:HAMP domain-containing sensor histidine kinase [Oceanobacillus zhaokaii]AXI08005.1 sensor histidine kinase [Oceanobacillus zhaokaii]